MQTRVAICSFRLVLFPACVGTGGDPKDLIETDRIAAEVMSELHDGE